jgi:hypothetical protein
MSIKEPRPDRRHRTVSVGRTLLGAALAVAAAAAGTFVAVGPAQALDGGAPVYSATSPFPYGSTVTATFILDPGYSFHHCTIAPAGNSDYLSVTTQTFAIPTTFPGEGAIFCRLTPAGGGIHITGEFYYEVSAPTDDSTPPVLTVPDSFSAVATSSEGAVVSFEASAADDTDGPITPNCVPASGTTFAPGDTTVTCTATDVAGNVGTGNFVISVIYAWSGVLQPVNAAGDSIFQAGRTVPVKFALTGASSGVSDLAAEFSWAKMGDFIEGGTVEALTNVAPTAGNLFRYDPTAGQYIFNWSTKGLGSGTYLLTIDLGDGTEHTVVVSLRR